MARCADLMDVVVAWATGTHFFDIYKMMELFEVSSLFSTAEPIGCVLRWADRMACASSTSTR